LIIWLDHSPPLFRVYFTSCAFSPLTCVPYPPDPLFPHGTHGGPTSPGLPGCPPLFFFFVSCFFFSPPSLFRWLCSFPLCPRNYGHFFTCPSFPCVVFNIFLSRLFPCFFFNFFPAVTSSRSAQFETLGRFQWDPLLPPCSLSSRSLSLVPFFPPPLVPFVVTKFFRGDPIPFSFFPCTESCSRIRFFFSRCPLWSPLAGVP